MVEFGAARTGCPAFAAAPVLARSEAAAEIIDAVTASGDIGAAGTSAAGGAGAGASPAGIRAVPMGSSSSPAFSRFFAQPSDSNTDSMSPILYLWLHAAPSSIARHAQGSALL